MRTATGVGFGLAGGAALAAAGILYASSRSRPVLSDPAPPDPPAGLPPARIVAVPGHGEIFVREAAPAAARADLPTVVLLHGWMFPADLNWFTSYEPLSRFARVLAVDHRGHGRGARPSDPFRLEDVADDVAALVRHLDLGPVVAVGYSMGGPIAQLLWRRHRDLVRGLVLCATSASFADRLRDRVVWRGMGLLQLALRLLPRQWAEHMLRAQVQGTLPVRVSRMITADTPPEVLERVAWIVGELSRGSAEDLAEAGRELSRFDAHGWLHEIDVPTAVIVTTRDQLVPPDRQYDLAARVPGAVCYEVDADHDAPAPRAGSFVTALSCAVEHVLSAAAPR